MFSSLIVVPVVLATFSKMALAQCPCYPDNGDDNHMVCENITLTSIPDCVADTITRLYIFTPSIPLDLTTIQRFTNLEYIAIGQFKDPQMSKTFLSAQPDLSRFAIYLTNTLHYIDNDWFQYTPKMKAIYLPGNKITSFSSETFSSLPLLEAVTLENNELGSLPPTLFQGTNLKNLTMSGNPWQCDCDLATFVQWLRENEVLIVDVPTCLYPTDLAGLELTQLTPDAVCKK